MRCAGYLHRQGSERCHQKRARPVGGLGRDCDSMLEQLDILKHSARVLGNRAVALCAPMYPQELPW
jgi:hypothetical protein